MVEINAAVPHTVQRFGRSNDVRFFLQHLRDPFPAGRAHGHHHEDHGQHHQRGERGHHIGKQRSQVAGGHAPGHDEARPEPGNRNNTAVDDKHHNRQVQRLELLRADKQLVEPCCCFAELFVLIVLPDKGFHHTDGGNILLNAGVQVVIAMEHMAENFHGLAHNQSNRSRQHHNSGQEDHQRAVKVDIPQISGLNALVDEAGDHKGNQKLRHHLQHRENRGDDSVSLVFPDLLQKRFYQE